MEYSFSWGTFGFGILIMVVGTLLVLFHRKIADTMGSGAVEYERYKLAGVIAVAVGIVVALNLVNFLLSLLLGGIFHPIGS